MSNACIFTFIYVYDQTPLNRCCIEFIEISRPFYFHLNFCLHKCVPECVNAASIKMLLPMPLLLSSWYVNYMISAHSLSLFGTRAGGWWRRTTMQWHTKKNNNSSSTQTKEIQKINDKRRRNETKRNEMNTPTITHNENENIQSRFSLFTNIHTQPYAYAHTHTHTHNAYIHTHPVCSLYHHSGAGWFCC